MSESLSFAEIEGQHVELLPARTVLSLMFTTPHGGNGGAGYGGIGINQGNGALNGAHQTNVAGGGFGGDAHGGIGGNGGDGHGGFGINSATCRRVLAALESVARVTESEATAARAELFPHG
jgi:hypothetical protein